MGLEVEEDIEEVEEDIAAGPEGQEEAWVEEVIILKV